MSATSAVSETPELINGDECASVIGGKRWARQTLNRTLRNMPVPARQVGERVTGSWQLPCDPECPALAAQLEHLCRTR